MKKQRHVGEPEPEQKVDETKKRKPRGSRKATESVAIEPCEPRKRTARSPRKMTEATQDKPVEEPKQRKPRGSRKLAQPSSNQPVEQKPRKPRGSRKVAQPSSNQPVEQKPRKPRGSRKVAEPSSNQPVEQKPRKPRGSRKVAQPASNQPVEPKPRKPRGSRKVAEAPVVEEATLQDPFETEEATVEVSEPGERPVRKLSKKKPEGRVKQTPTRADERIAQVKYSRATGKFTFDYKEFTPEELRAIINQKPPGLEAVSYVEGGVAGCMVTYWNLEYLLSEAKSLDSAPQVRYSKGKERIEEPVPDELSMFFRRVKPHH